MPEFSDYLTGYPHKPIVYFLHIGDIVKIGTSTNLRTRLWALALAERNVSRIIPGDRETEIMYHRKFARLQIQGEWFRYQGTLKMFLESEIDATALNPLLTLSEIVAREIVPVTYDAIRKRRQRDDKFPEGILTTTGRRYNPEIIRQYYKEMAMI